MSETCHSENSGTCHSERSEESFPQFRYFLYDRRHPVEKQSEIWQKPLPMKSSISRQYAGVSLKHGEYFCAVQKFWESREQVTGSRLQGAGGRGQVTENNLSPTTCNLSPATCDLPPSIFLEKHGEFYHPARIEATENGEKTSFAVNVAISDTGKACIRGEYDILKQLNDDFPEYSFLPKVYEYGEIRSGGAEIPMFSGEWFDGYHEFHLSYHQQERKNRMIVWDSEKGNFFLSSEQACEIYAHAAMILTCYYDAETFAQIYPWHHAAGDFIVKVQDEAAPIKTGDVKLITVRQYRQQADEAEKPDAYTVLDALLVFFLNLSIRMRLDRLDGVGEMAWADDIAVAGTVAGFFRGLAMKAPVSVLPAPLDLCFQYYFLQRTEAELFDLSEAIMNAYSPDSAEFPVIRKHLKAHTDELYRAVILELGIEN